MSIATVLTGVENFVEAEIKKGEVSISTWWTGFEPMVEADFQAFVTAMQPVALALVTGLANAAINGSVKFSVASSALVSVAESQGLKSSMTMANQLIQQIVTSLSAAKPPA